jgi:hypothetical protein
MRHIQKGNPPALLLADGAEFQDAALEFAITGKTVGKYSVELEKYAVYTENGAFDHYGSGLFAKRSFYSEPVVKRQLIAEHAGKCAFCESFIMDTDVGDVEHFRPKSMVTTRHPSDPLIEVSVDSHPGYFWLSANWENLYLSCKQCNQAFKKNFFDVWPNSQRKTLGARDVEERHLLLSPAMADDHLRRLVRYNPTTAEAMLNPESPYGVLPEQALSLPRISRTIEIVGLNRPRLKEARANHLVKLRALFVLVANGGGLPGSASPLVTDTRPAILDFLVYADSAAADARLALTRAVLPSAEFSALALDALIVWSAELQLQQNATPIALQQANHVRLVLTPQRLLPQIKLAETLRESNVNSDISEAWPDISDLDALYMALLVRYKAALKVIAPLRPRFDQRMKEAKQKSNLHLAMREKDGLVSCEDQYLDAQATLSQLLLEAGYDKTRVKQPEFDNTEARLQKMDQELKTEPLLTMIAQDNERRAVIDGLLEQPGDHWNILNAIHEDLVDVQEGYRVRGVPRAKRGDQCEKFMSALDEALTWLDTGNVLSKSFLAQLKTKKPSGFPPGFRT